MRRILIIASLVGAAFAVPNLVANAAPASCGDVIGTTATGDYNALTSDADAGVCMDLGDNATGFRGGNLEAGTGAPGTYVVADGHNGNSDPTGEADGYVGVSDYETGDDATEEDCVPTAEGGQEGGTGSNSGGCVGIDNPTGQGPSGVAVYLGEGPTPVCGSESGPDFTDSKRDGCRLGT